MAIPLKTEYEINSMRRGGKILAEVLESVLSYAKAGVSTYELDRLAENLILAANAKPGFKGYKGYPATLCTSINDIIVHGIPKEDEILKEGDLLKIDCGVIMNDMYTDAARAKGIGPISPEKEKLIRTAEIALEEAINLAKPGTHLNKIGEKIQEIVEKAGFHIIRDLTGHGVGKNLHEDPIVTNFWEGIPGPVLREGMTLAIEPIFSVGTSEMKTLSDGWTIVTVDGSNAIQVENTILITRNGTEVLTKV
ncbi:MAG: type I methionyl aminopeptidase [Candidatus Peregrinibacteria bacterium]